jgi:hypothetical protein
MRFARNFNVKVEELGTSDSDKRRHGRVMCQGITCSLGNVLDLSASGMRIKTRFKLPEKGEVFVISIETMDGPLGVLGRVRWTKRRGLVMREAGVEFFDVGPRTRAILSQLAGRVAYNENRNDARAAG